MRVLAFGAHPDDVEERMGGTLAKHAAQGDEIFVCIATNGEIGSYDMDRKELAELRHREAQESCDIIGAHLIWLGFEDEMLFDCRETRMAFIDAVREARPDIIYAPPKYSDYNQDHDITGYLAFEARILATVKLMETKHSIIDNIPPMFLCTAMGGLSSKTNPQYFVDITDTYETKMKMYACHRSQITSWGEDAFGVSYTEMCEAETRFYAAACGSSGVKRVEAFTLCTDWPITAGAHKLLP